jgi:hypothetical protein
MKKLTIFDDGKWAATITQVDNGSIYIFARSPIDWREANRLITFGYKVGPKDPKFLEQVAIRAHEYNFSTELV